MWKLAAGRHSSAPWFISVVFYVDFWVEQECNELHREHKLTRIDFYYTQALWSLEKIQKTTPYK